MTVGRLYNSRIATLVRMQLEGVADERTIAFVCQSIDNAKLDDTLRNDFPREAAFASMDNYPATALGDTRRHFAVDLYDKKSIPIGSMRVYLEGDCVLLHDASEQTMLLYKARIGLL